MEARVDERVSARTILAALVLSAISCSVIAAALFFTRLNRHLKESSAEQEAIFLLKASALVLNNDLLAANLFAANENLTRLINGASLSHVCIGVSTESGDEVFSYTRGTQCRAATARSLKEHVYFDLKHLNLAYTIHMNYLPHQALTTKPSSMAYNAYSIALVLVFLLLILVIVYMAVRFGNWLFDELSLTVGGRRTAPPAILSNIRIRELEWVWKTVDDLNQVVRSKTLFDVSSRVAHDIRSPLSALNMVLGSIKDLPEPKRVLIRSATNRINDIANELIKDGKRANAEAQRILSQPVQRGGLTESNMLVALLDSLISEKRVQYRDRTDIDIHGDFSFGYGLFANVNAAELSRTISNLIDNAIEACIDGGQVTLAIRYTGEMVDLIVSDTGIGMTKEHLARVGQKGFSQGKDVSLNGSGSGLGVFHARTCVEALGGHLRIESRLNVGTNVHLYLPRAESPSWFLERISVYDGMTIVSMDDDQSIHQLWRGRLRQTSMSITVRDFSSASRFESWLSETNAHRSLYLIDYELIGQNTNGLELIERNEIASCSVLVTSHYDEAPVRAHAARLGVRLLPKNLSALVPIEASDAAACRDATYKSSDLSL